MTAALGVRRDRPRARVDLAPPSAARGFTLIELIIALALVALITVLLFSGLRLGSRAWDGVDAVAERNAELRSARGFLDRALMQSRDLVLRFDEEDRQTFAGNATNLEFVAPLSEHVGVPGLYVLRLGLDGRGEHSRLVLTRWLLHPDVLAGNADAPEWEPLDPDSPADIDSVSTDRDLAAGAFGQTVLLEQVGELELAYFGVAEQESQAGTQTTGGGPSGQVGLGDEEPEGQWYAEWVGQPHPPKLIRVHLTSRRQDWPDSIIRLPQVEQALGGQIQVGTPQVLPDPGGQPQGGSAQAGPGGSAPNGSAPRGLSPPTGVDR
jgi:general secretion pathway protein J